MELRYYQFMGINCLNIAYSCSTLVLFAFNDYEISKRYDFDFIKNIKHCMTRDWVPRYAHVFASTTEGQPKTQAWFRKLGFIESPPQFNSKNETVCTLFMIPVPVLQEKLKEYT